MQIIIYHYSFQVLSNDGIVKIIKIRMHSLRLSDRTMSYDAGLNMYMHQKPPNQDRDDNDEANEADGTIIIDPHNGATIKGKSHRKISTGKKENYILTPHFLLFQEEERLNSFVIQSYRIILVIARGVFKKSTKSYDFT